MVTKSEILTVAKTGLPGRKLVADLKGYAFVLPYFFFFLVFILIPLIYGLYLSFVSWDLFSEPEFIGLQNYQNLLFNDTRFWVSVRSTLTFVAESVPLLIIIPLIFALILNRPFRGRTWAFVAFISVSFLPSVPILWIWGWMLEPTSGMFNYYLDSLNLGKLNWMSNPTTAMIFIAIITVWWTSGFNGILFLSGLQDIPRELYEAAQVDGGTRWAQFRFITLPMLRDKMLLILALTVIGSVRIFDQIYILLPGGYPGGQTRTMALYLYENGFRDFRIGKAAAISWLMFLMVFLFVAVRTYFDWVGARKRVNS